MQNKDMNATIRFVFAIVNHIDFVCSFVYFLLAYHIVSLSVFVNYNLHIVECCLLIAIQLLLYVSCMLIWPNRVFSGVQTS